ncbi:hypothetical protein LINGRAPRIM_LOCUS2507 [Linum grandiflorum]
MAMSATISDIRFLQKGIHLGKIANDDGLEIEGALGGRSRR